MKDYVISVRSHLLAPPPAPLLRKSPHTLRGQTQRHDGHGNTNCVPAIFLFYLTHVCTAVYTEKERGYWALRSNPEQVKNENKDDKNTEG